MSCRTGILLDLPLPCPHPIKFPSRGPSLSARFSLAPAFSFHRHFSTGKSSLPYFEHLFDRHTRNLCLVAVLCSHDGRIASNWPPQLCPVGHSGRPRSGPRVGHGTSDQPIQPIIESPSCGGSGWCEIRRAAALLGLVKSLGEPPLATSTTRLRSSGTISLVNSCAPRFSPAHTPAFIISLKKGCVAGGCGG